MTFLHGKIDYANLSSDFLSALQALEDAVMNSGISMEVLELIRYKASVLHNCQYCQKMHLDIAKKEGLELRKFEQVMSHMSSDQFTQLEKDILTLTEKLTLLAEHPIDFELQARIIAETSAETFSFLVLAITQINAWNRIVKSFGW